MFKKNIFFAALLLLSAFSLYAQPMVYCYQGLSVDILPTTNNVILFGKHFVADYSDKKYDIKDLKIKIQIPSAAKDATYDATKAKDEAIADCVGIVPVTIWVVNPEGQTERCDTYVDVQNNMGATLTNCPLQPSGICIMPDVRAVGLDFGKARAINFEKNLSYSETPNGKPSYPFFDNPFKPNLLKRCVPLNKYFNIDFYDPTENYLAGISTFDLVLLSKHVLGTQILKDSFQFTAGDINNSGKITTADIVELRQLVLGHIKKFRNNFNWKPYPVYQPAGILNQSYSFHITKDITLGFKMVKIGDINLSASAATPKTQTTHYFDLENKALQSGETYRLVLDNQQLDGFQAALKYDTEALGLLQTDAFSKVSADGIIKTAQLRGERTELVFQVKKDIFLSDAIGLEETALAAEAYENNEIKKLVLRFAQPKVATLKLFQNYPNPTTGVTTIQFQAPAVAPYQLCLFDSNGKKVQSFDNQAISGLNQLEVSLSQNGFYTYQIIYQGEVLVGKVVVVK